MKTAPTNWATIVAGENYKYECKINVAGVDVLQSGIYELSINGSAIGQEAASIGYAVAGEIDVSLHIEEREDPDINLDGGTFIWTNGDNADGGSFWSGGIDADGGTFIGIYIPKMAPLIPYIRVVDEGNGNVSGWLKMGEYFIDTREKDVKNGKFRAHGYDAMLKAEQTYFPSVTSGSMTAKAIVEEIAVLIGTTVHVGTNLILTAKTYNVPYYAGQYTAREMLAYIAAAYCGTFIIDEYGKLKLVRLVDAGTAVDIGAKAASLELSEETLSYDKVTIVIDSTHAVTSGSGNSELEFDCPFGTQDMADTILAWLSNYTYRGYSAGTAVITPLCQLGDSVTIKGNTLQILKRGLKFNALMASDLEAPYSEEIQHEFVYEPATERKIERYYNNVQSEFSIQASEIASKVSETDFTGNTVVSKINQTATTVAIEASKINLNGAVTANDYFKILANGTFQANRGEIGDLVLEDGTLVAICGNPHTYTASDIARIDDILLGGVTPTQEDYDLYDVDDDGEITDLDKAIIQVAINDYGGDITSRTVINPRTAGEMISVSANGNRTTLGVDGVKTNALEVDGNRVASVITSMFKGAGLHLGYGYSDGTKMFSGKVNLGSVTFDTSHSWGYSYYVSFSYTFPLGLTLRDTFSVTASAQSNGGLIAVTIQNITTTGFDGYVWSPKAETRTVTIHYWVSGT